MRIINCSCIAKSCNIYFDNKETHKSHDIINLSKIKIDIEKIKLDIIKANEFIHSYLPSVLKNFHSKRIQSEYDKCIAINRDIISLVEIIIHSYNKETYNYNILKTISTLTVNCLKFNYENEFSSKNLFIKYLSSFTVFKYKSRLHFLESTSIQNNSDITIIKSLCFLQGNRLLVTSINPEIWDPNNNYNIDIVIDEICTYAFQLDKGYIITFSDDIQILSLKKYSYKLVIHVSQPNGFNWILNATPI